VRKVLIVSSPCSPCARSFRKFGLMSYSRIVCISIIVDGCCKGGAIFYLCGCWFCLNLLDGGVLWCFVVV
jgi:hypothetical protein